MSAHAWLLLLMANAAMLVVNLIAGDGIFALISAAACVVCFHGIATADR